MSLTKRWNRMTKEQRASLALAAQLTPEAGFHIKNMAWDEIPAWLVNILRATPVEVRPKEEEK